MAKGREVVFNCSLPSPLPRQESGGFGSGPAGPIDPSHPAVVWRPQRWTWVCSRSWGWETGEESTSASVSSVQPPSPAATARPSSPSLWQRDSWSLAAASAWSWMMVGTVSGTGWTGVWCWPGAGTGVL